MPSASLVDAVKNLQRSDPEIKQQWQDYCENELGGVKDPNRHDDEVLQNFLNAFGHGHGQAARPSPAPRSAPRPQPRMSAPVPQFGGGGKGKHKGMQMGGMDMMGMGMGMPMGGQSDLVGFIKMGQKQSAAYKAAWGTYCQLYGGGLNDPARHDPQYIVDFIDYLGQLAQADMGANAAVHGYSMPSAQPRMMDSGRGGGNGRKRPMDAGHAVGEPPRKKGGGGNAYSGGGNSDKDTLVQRVKALQRSDPATKEAWWAFTDENHGGVHDPNRHGEDVLEAFLANYE